MDEFEYHLYGEEFVLQTDQQPLTDIRNMKYCTGKLMRWSLSLETYSSLESLILVKFRSFVQELFISLFQFNTH